MTERSDFIHSSQSARWGVAKIRDEIEKRSLISAVIVNSDHNISTYTKCYVCLVLSYAFKLLAEYATS